jgi:tRNA threonylcarbamoyladenosine biosynthesis protein TsaE
MQGMDQSSAMEFCFDSPDPETTFALAALLGRSIGARGLAIGLVGPLGAGKTLFVKGLAEGLGVDPRIVSSPTFVIAQQYRVPEGPEALHHLDFYRLESEAELDGIGFVDLLRPGQVIAVEWLDRFPEALGEEQLRIELLPVASPASGDTGQRRLRATARGAEPARVLRDWAERAERLARDRRAAGGSGGAGRGDASLLLALLATAAFSLLADPEIASESRRACAALVPAAEWESAPRGHAAHSSVSANGLRPAAGDDGLGPLQVRCAGDRHLAGGGEALSGIARLLDGGRIDANSAPRRLLENLPGVGASRADAIVEARASRPFGSIHELERVPGIGPATRAKLEPFLSAGEAG